MGFFSCRMDLQVRVVNCGTPSPYTVAIPEAYQVPKLIFLHTLGSALYIILAIAVRRENASCGSYEMRVLSSELRFGASLKLRVVAEV